jgi:hypothetical protein
MLIIRAQFEECQTALGKLVRKLVERDCVCTATLRTFSVCFLFEIKQSVD